MLFILIIITIIILILMYYFFRKWYYFIYIKNKIFPLQLSDIKLNDSIKSEPNYHRIVQASKQKLKYDEMVFLLKYKKFVDLPQIYSMCSVEKINQTQKLLETIIKKKINGCLVETGVWKGGMSMWMKCVLNYYRDKRHIWLFDTFEYFPQPQNILDANIHAFTKILFENMPNVYDVASNFKKFGLLDQTIHFVKGEFSKTIPKTNPGTIAILRLDSDYYEPTMLVLETYYDNLITNGYVIIDDYGNNYVACKTAVNDFRKKRNIISPIHNIHQESVYWIKT
jgi:hypothetical protein